MFNENRFKAAIIEKGFSLRDVANAMQIAMPTLYRKMKGESDFYRNEIIAYCDLLGINDASKMNDIFFDEEVAFSQQREILN